MTDNNDNDEPLFEHPAIKETMAAEQEQADPMPTDWGPTDEVIKDKIMQVLTLYPRVSGSMLQVGIGTSIYPKMWRPVFERLISVGIIKQGTVSMQSATGRYQQYTIIELVNPPKTPEPIHGDPVAAALATANAV